MAGVDIEIVVHDDVTASFVKLIAAGADLTAVMGDIAGHGADETRERFETQRDPSGVPWKPSRRVLEHGGETLTLSGDLRNSIREDWGVDFAAWGPEASGGAAVYALIHQKGGEIRPREKKALSFGGIIVSKVVMPKREYLGWTEADDDYALRALADHFGAALGGGATV